MKITYITSAEDSAIVYYRQVLPASLMKKYSNIRINSFCAGQPLEHLEECCASDIFYFQGLGDERWINFAKEMQIGGKKIIIDIDDNFFCVNPLSPHYKDFGLKNFKWELPDGTVGDVWKDGVNFDIERNRKNLEGIIKGLNIADLVTVTTPILAEVYKPHCNEIAVLPNCLDFNVWNKLPLLPRKNIRIGWFGGHSHYNDWYIIKDVVPAIANKYPQVKFVILGQVFWNSLKGIRPEQIELHSWVHHQAYPLKAASLDLDISIIPLEENEFNICKSPIKWLEMASLEVGSVASYISPYKEMYDGSNGVFVENDRDAWIEGISYLIEHPLERHKMARMARKYAEDNYDIEKKYTLWTDAYNKVLKGVLV